MLYLYLTIFALIGGFSRYAQSYIVQKYLGRAFPYATLSINILGSFAMGFLLGFFSIKHVPAAVRTGILVGGVGTYTTFSTFSLETLNLIEERQYLRMAGYVIASVIGGIIAVALGFAFASVIVGN